MFGWMSRLVASISRMKRSTCFMRPGSRRILSAVTSPVFSRLARKMIPIPPRPISSSRRQLPIAAPLTRTGLVPVSVGVVAVAGERSGSSTVSFWIMATLCSESAPCLTRISESFFFSPFAASWACSEIATFILSGWR